MKSSCIKSYFHKINLNIFSSAYNLVCIHHIIVVHMINAYSNYVYIILLLIFKTHKTGRPISLFTKDLMKLNLNLFIY